MDSAAATTVAKTAMTGRARTRSAGVPMTFGDSWVAP